MITDYLLRVNTVMGVYYTELIKKFLHLSRKNAGEICVMVCCIITTVHKHVHPQLPIFACCSCSAIIDTHTLSKHRSRVLIRRWFSLPAYTWVTKFCYIFGHGNGSQLIRGMAYTRVYTVSRVTLQTWESVAVHVGNWDDMANSATLKWDLTELGHYTPLDSGSLEKKVTPELTPEITSNYVN